MRVKVRFVVPNATFNNISVISCRSVFTGGGNRSTRKWDSATIKFRFCFWRLEIVLIRLGSVERTIMWFAWLSRFVRRECVKIPGFTTYVDWHLGRSEERSCYITALHFSFTYSIFCIHFHPSSPRFWMEFMLLDLLFSFRLDIMLSVGQLTYYDYSFGTFKLYFLIVTQ